MRAMKCMFVGIYLLVIAAFCLMVGTMYNLSAVAFVCLTCAGPVAGLLYHRPLQQTVKAERVRTSGPKKTA